VRVGAEPAGPGADGDARGRGRGRGGEHLGPRPKLPGADLAEGGQDHVVGGAGEEPRAGRAAGDPDAQEAVRDPVVEPAHDRPRLDAAGDRVEREHLDRQAPVDDLADRHARAVGEEHRRVVVEAAEHHADLLAQLVREDADRSGPVQRPRQLPEGLGHEAGLEADVGVAHLALDLRLRHQGRDRVDRDHVEGPRAHQEVGDLERLLAVVGLGDEELVGVDPDAARVGRVHRVLGVDEGGEAAPALRLRDDVVEERRLSGALRSVHLDDPAPGEPSDAECQVEREGAGGDRRDVEQGRVPHPHDGALAELPLDLGDRRAESLGLLHDAVSLAGQDGPSWTVTTGS
jgi:hypothetical protein